MEKENVRIYYGSGKGKTALTLGMAMMYAGEGKSVFVIQFLKGRMGEQLDYMKSLEPDVKVFRFEKSTRYFEDISEEEKQEEIINIRNGLNFARKVLKIGECDVLILDEALGLVDLGSIGSQDLKDIIEAGDDSTQLILTGINLPEGMADCAGYIARLDVVKNENC